jgi:uncharacterized protein YdcH (DUF465 family)
MEQKDYDLIQSLLPRDEELARLWNEHLELEKRLDDLNERLYLSNEEQVELKHLKKVKLAGRDRIETILASYRDDPDK